MRIPIRALAFAGAALFIAGAAEADSLALTIGELRRQPVAGVVANVVVADPAIADVMVIDQHSVVIQAKGFGVTQILATDHAGHVLIDDRIIITAPPEEGRVTVFRGLTGYDYSCMPNCRAVDASPSSSAVSVAGAPQPSGYQQPAPAPTVAPPVTVQTVAPLHP